MSVDEFKKVCVQRPDGF